MNIKKRSRLFSLPWVIFSPIGEILLQENRIAWKDEISSSFGLFPIYFKALSPWKRAHSRATERADRHQQFFSRYDWNRKKNVLISTCYLELPQRWKYDRAPSLLLWKKKFQSKKKRQKAPFPGLSLFVRTLISVKCKKNDSRGHFWP